jgi:rod shape determining protein RodA
MKEWIRHIRSFDWILWIAVAMIAVMGLMLVYNIAQSQTKIQNIFQKQAAVVAIGLFIIVFVSFFDYRMFRNWSSSVLLLYFASLAALILVLVWGSVAHGSRSWFLFGGWGFQPVELAKLTLVIVLAKYFSLSHIEIHRWQHIFISGLYFIILFALVLMQPDLGSAVTLFLVWIGMMLVAGIGWKKLLILGLIGVVVAALSWMYFFKPYQKNRILTFLNPSLDPLGVSYNRQQALIAVGSGGLWGRGFGNASQSRYGFLPEVYNDFIVSSLAETWGLAGVVALCVLWFVIAWRIAKIALRAENNFASFFSAGFLILLLSHFFINAAVNFGIIPITGISSPFFSAGGSQFLIFSFGIGLIESIRISHSS